MIEIISLHHIDDRLLFCTEILLIAGPHALFITSHHAKANDISGTVELVAYTQGKKPLSTR